MLVAIGFILCVLVIASLVIRNEGLAVDNDRLRGLFSDTVSEVRDLEARNQKLLDHVTQLAAEHRERDAKGRYTRKG